MKKTLKHVQALMDGMRKDASMPSATNGEMMAPADCRKTAAGSRLEQYDGRHQKYGVAWRRARQVRGCLYIAYAETLKVARDVIEQRVETLAELFKEQEALDADVATAKERLNNVLAVQGVQAKADQGCSGGDEKDRCLAG